VPRLNPSPLGRRGDTTSTAVGSRVTAVSLGQKGQLVCGGGGLHRSTATFETTGVRSQAFYRNSKLGTSDFCENVGSESAAYIVLESQPRGLQARFTQSLAFCVAVRGGHGCGREEEPPSPSGRISEEELVLCN
jgi:hypothetical protein